jgi:hypothetical protein
MRPGAASNARDEGENAERLDFTGYMNSRESSSFQRRLFKRAPAVCASLTYTTVE